MKSRVKLLSIVLSFILAFMTLLDGTAVQAAEKQITVPKVEYVNAPVLEYTAGDVVNFNLYSPNYGGKVQYRVVLWDNNRKETRDLWTTGDRYYTNWMPYGNNIFNLHWRIDEPGSYRITVYVKRAGITNIKTALKEYNCDSYMESMAFIVKEKDMVFDKDGQTYGSIDVNKAETYKGKISITAKNVTFSNASLEGNLNITGDNAVISNINISGKLVIDPGKDGSCILDNVTAKEVYVLSGGQNSIHIKNSHIGTMDVNTQNPVRVEVDGDTEIVSTSARGYVIFDRKNGTYGTISIMKAENGEPVIEFHGDIKDKVVVETAAAIRACQDSLISNLVINTVSNTDTVKLEGKYDRVEINSKARLEVGAGSRIENIIANNDAVIHLEKAASITNVEKRSNEVIINSDTPVENDNDSGVHLPSKISLRAVAITGTPSDGIELTAVITPAKATASYHWKICKTVKGIYSNIAKATTNKYTPTADDVGKYIKVSATGTGKYAGSVTSKIVKITEAAADNTISAVDFTAAAGLQEGSANAAAGATVGTLSATGGDEPITYALAAGDGTNDADNGKFEISGTEVKVAEGALTSGTYKFYVEAADKDGDKYGKACKITVAEVESPEITDIGLAINSGLQVGSDNTAANAEIGTLTATGGTPGFTYELAADNVTPANSADNGSFAISADKLKVAAGALTKAKNYKVTIMVTDDKGMTYTKGFTIEVSPVPITAITEISGTAKVGVELTAGTLTPAEATVDYQWQISDNADGTYKNIDGAITNKYTPAAGDVDKYIKVSATGTGNYSGTVISAATSIVEPATISISKISGVTAPVTGETPVSAIPDTAEYTAAITWLPADSAFVYGTEYTAAITISPKSGYTLTGIPANFFKVAGAEATNEADSGAVKAVFPKILNNQSGLPSLTGLPATFGMQLTVESGTLSVVTNLTYTWYRSANKTYEEELDTQVGTGTSYTPAEADINNYLIVIATTPDALGNGTAVTPEAVAKAPGPAGPSKPPVLVSKTDTSVTLAGNSGYEYSKNNGAVWQDNSVFTGLSQSTTYTFTFRIKATSTINASSQSPGLTVTTDAAVSASATPMNTAPGSTVIILNRAITGLAAEDFTVMKNEVQLNNLTNYYISALDTTNITITFTSSTELDKSYMVTVKITKDGYYVNNGIPIAVPNNIPVLIKSITVTSADGTDTVLNGSTLQMIAAVTPSNADDQTITWSVEPGTGTANISSNGLLTGTGRGNVTVKAVNEYSGVTGTKVITVEAPAPALEQFAVEEGADQGYTQVTAASYTGALDYKYIVLADAYNVKTYVGMAEPAGFSPLQLETNIPARAGQHLVILALDSVGQVLAVTDHTLAAGEVRIQPISIYMADYTNNRIIACTSTDSNAQILVPVVESYPYSGPMAITAASGRIYWAEQDSCMIRSAALDGTDIKPVINTGSNNISAIAVADGKIYWADYTGNRICSAFLDGSNVSVVIPDADNSPFTNNKGPLAMTISGQKIYWAGDMSGIIECAGLDGTNRCIVTPTTPIPQSVCSIAVDEAEGKIYWNDYSTNSIWGASLTGGMPLGIVIPIADKGAGTTGVLSISIKNGRIYWTCDSNGEIHRAKLDGSYEEIIYRPASPVYISGIDVE